MMKTQTTRQREDDLRSRLAEAEAKAKEYRSDNVTLIDKLEQVETDRDRLRAALETVRGVLAEHRRFHDKIACPGGADCRVCCAEAGISQKVEMHDWCADCGMAFPIMALKTLCESCQRQAALAHGGEREGEAKEEAANLYEPDRCICGHLQNEHYFQKGACGRFEDECGCSYFQSSAAQGATMAREGSENDI